VVVGAMRADVDTDSGEEGPGSAPRVGGDTDALCSGADDAALRRGERICDRMGRTRHVAYLQHSHWRSVVKEWRNECGQITRRQMRSAQFPEQHGSPRFLLLQESVDAPVQVWETNRWKFQLSEHPCFWAALLSADEGDADGSILSAYQSALVAERGFGVQVGPKRRGVAVTTHDADVLELIHFFQTH
jgi:hypothetical protein